MGRGTGLKTRSLWFLAKKISVDLSKNFILRKYMPKESFGAVLSDFLFNKNTFWNVYENVYAKLFRYLFSGLLKLVHFNCSIVILHGLNFHLRLILQT
jgi:hypothetical protein